MDFASFIGGFIAGVVVCSILAEAMTMATERRLKKPITTDRYKQLGSVDP